MKDRESPQGTAVRRPRRDSAAVTGTCGGCDARWTAKTWCHCASCHRTFSSLRLFDRHRVGGCQDPETVIGKSGEPVMFFRDGIWRGPEWDGGGLWADK